MKQPRLLLFIFLSSIPSLQAAPQLSTVPRWQQTVRYQIQAGLDTTARRLNGEMTLFYQNNSPDTLRGIYLQVPANAFHDEENTAAREMRRFNRGGIRFDQSQGHELTISSLQFLSVGGQSEFAIQAFNFHDTILNLSLPAPLMPGDTLSLLLYFTQDYSKLFEHATTDRLQLEAVLWFPRVCVYDEEGWHAEPFHFMMDAGDVYSEFAEMDVTITVPGNYVVVGSGDLTAGDPGWSAVAVDTAMASKTFAAWRDSLRRELRERALQNGPHTVRFHARRAHNFIWSASPNFLHFEKPGSPAIHLFARSRDDLKSTLNNLDRVFNFLQDQLGPYPFPHLNIVQNSRTPASAPMLILSEDAETFGLTFSGAGVYVPGMVANNGVKEAWMARGLATYLAKAVSEKQYGKQGYDTGEAREDMNFIERQYPLPSLDNVFRNLARFYMDSGQNEPIANEIHEYRDPVGMAANVYLKSEIFYEMLRYVVGDSIFTAILHEYVQEYSFRHANEEDFRAVCERVSGQSLAWFFDQWLHGTVAVDYKKGAVKTSRRNDTTWVTEVEIQRKAEGIMPVDVVLDLGNDEKIVKRWDGKAETGAVVFETNVKPQGVQVDPEDRIMDGNMLNNGRRRIEFKPDLPFMRFIHMPNDAYLVLWRPALGYNDVDGLRLGLRARSSYRAFYNNLTLEAIAGLGSGAIDGKFAYHHPLRRSNLLNRYHLLARKNEGRFEADAHLEFNGSNGIVTASGRSLEIGVNYSGLLDGAYTFLDVSNDTGKVRFQEWDDVDLMLAYARARARFGNDKVDVEARVRAETALPVGEVEFTKLSGRVELDYFSFGFMLRARANGAASFGPDDLPRQDRFRAEGAAPRERFQNDVVKTGGDWLAFSRRYVEGGGLLRGYAGQPLPAAHFATWNFELGPASRGGSLRFFGFYDAGRIWEERSATAITRSNAGFGFSFLGSKSRFFGGNLSLFSNFSVRVYFPVWISAPPPGEKQTQFRWYFAFGKSL